MSTEYLSNAISGSEQLGGIAINCTSNHGASQLCHELVNLVTNPELENENFHRSGYGFLGRGMFGTVFERKVGRDRYAIKIIQHVERIRNFRQEVDLQQTAASAMLAPRIYDHFICQCNDKTYGIIIMDLLKNYVSHGLVQTALQTMGNIGSQIAHALNNRLEQILRTLQGLGIQIVDFQIMYHPNIMLALDARGVPNESIQVIDFGFTEDPDNFYLDQNYIEDQLDMYHLLA